MTSIACGAFAGVILIELIVAPIGSVNLQVKHYVERLRYIVLENQRTRLTFRQDCYGLAVQHQFERVSVGYRAFNLYLAFTGRDVEHDGTRP